MSTLLPCAFCGGRDIAVPIIRATKALCQTCRARGPLKDRPSDALAAWNHRATNAVGLAMLSALQEVREYLSERAEAEYHTDSAPTGNEEMRLLVEVEAAIAAAEIARVAS